MKTKSQFSANVRWNARYGAVEVLTVDDENYQTIDFLTLDPEIKKLLSLHYLQSGCALSCGQNQFANLKSWLEAFVALGCNVDFHENQSAVIRFSIDILKATKNIVLASNGRGWDWQARFNDRFFSGFQTRLQAERFLLRLWNRSAGLYFINCPDDDTVQELWSLYQNQDLEGSRTAYEEMQRWTLGDYHQPDQEPRFSLTSADSGDSFYFDFYALPEPYPNYYFVCSSIDSVSGGFSSDFQADVVSGDCLHPALNALVSGAIAWMDDNGHDLSQTVDEVQELREKITVELQKS